MPNTQSLTETSVAVLGQMLVEIVDGQLTEATLAQIRQLPKEMLPQPFRDLAKQAGGSALTGELTRYMQIELRGILNELLS